MPTQRHTSCALNHLEAKRLPKARIGSIAQFSEKQIMHHFILIMLLAAFPALSTDMYLPALPTLCDTWGISPAQANLSLVSFFVTFSLFLLIHGPLSDRHGRRPVLLGGISLYIGGSLLCAVSPGITILVLARAVQAMGAAAASSVALALVKDLYEGDKRKKLLAYIGVIVPLCPMVAPTLGALLLEFVSWRGIFISQSILALPALIGSLRLKEPLEEMGTGGVGEAMRRYGRLARNGAFMGYSIAFSMAGFAFFCFIGGSAEIYIGSFGMSEQTYGLYFAFNALALMLGSFLCSRLCVTFDSKQLLIMSFTGMILSAAAIYLSVGDTAASFAMPMFGYTFFLGLSRPLSNHVILEQVNTDTGTAASVITFFFFIVGAIAMEIITIPWDSKPMFISAAGVAGALIPFLFLFRIMRRGRAV